MGSHTIKLIVFILLLAHHTTNGEIQTRNRGNIQRNNLDVISKNETEVTLISTRGDGPGKGRRVQSTFSSRSTRWASVGEGNGPVGVSMRLGLLAIIEYKESTTGPWGIDPSDTIVSTLPLVNMSFEPLVEFSDAQDDISYKYYILDSTEKSSVSVPNVFDNFQSMDPELNQLPLIRIGAGTFIKTKSILTQKGISDLRGFVSKLNRTLGPSTWQFGVEIFGFPYKRNDTFLALKFSFETQETPYIRYKLSYTERDDPFIEMNDIQAPAPNFSPGLAKSDLAYYSWEVTAVATQGMASNTTRSWTQKGIGVSEVTLGNSPLLELDEDYVKMSEVDGFLDSLEFGRNLNESSRHFMYVSIPVSSASSVSWDPYVGIDEQDDAVEKSGAVPSVVMFVLNLLCIISFLL